MCTTLPETLITVMGIEKVIPEWRDLAVLLQLLPALVDRGADEPVHLALDRRAPRGRAVRVPPRAARRRADAARSPTRWAGPRCGASAAPPASTSARSTGRPAGTRTRPSTPARSGRSCSPSWTGERGVAASLPYASSLCGACADVCPVGIDIPRILVHERAKVVRAGPARSRGARAARARPGLLERRAATSARSGSPACSSVRRCATAASAGSPVRSPAGGGRARCPASPPQTFREWWEARERAAREIVLGRIRAALADGPCPARRAARLPRARVARRRGRRRALRRARRGDRRDRRARPTTPVVAVGAVLARPGGGARRRRARPTRGAPAGRGRSRGGRRASRPRSSTASTAR